MSDEDLYERIADELQQGNIRRGLWLKCLHEAGGNEVRAKHAYVSARVHELKGERRAKQRCRAAINRQADAVRMRQAVASSAGRLATAVVGIVMGISLAVGTISAGIAVMAGLSEEVEAAVVSSIAAIVLWGVSEK